MELKTFFNGKNILVTGGTGSFGHEIVDQLTKLGPAKIIIFSRDEKKQYDMQHEFEEYKQIIEFVVGDVRDYEAVREAMREVNVVYHAAALKQVPDMERHPLEAIKTNVLGTENVRRAADDRGADVVVLISTDKAVKPVNVMGMSKAVAERIFLNPTNISKSKTKFVCVRYGNVIGSRGSVVPLFKEQILQNKPLTVTNFKMTRFLLRLEEAVELVFFATFNDSTGDLIVRKMPACYMEDLAKAMTRALTGREDYPIKEIGIRPGEKIHEILVSEEEMRRASEMGDYFLIHPYSSFEENYVNNLGEYSSDKTNILDQEAIITLLKKEGWV